ncbi:MAG: hypothetical protein C0412_18580, partial [Flavobacterium sp.]|nr:hypothetical protein [Flavobacterium sp.]
VFKDYWIYTSNFSWDKHPILRLNFSEMSFNSVEKFEKDFEKNLHLIADKYNIDLKSCETITSKTLVLIQEMAKTKQVVILVDEYDYPLISNIHRLNVAQDIRETLKSFYNIIKNADQYIKAVFITGVSKFSKVSIFSGMNNLIDLTIDEKSATLLGYTQQELECYFSDYIDQIAKKLSMSKQELLLEMKNWYNGYLFFENSITVYNPVSIQLFLKSGKFENHWFETGTPTFLIDLLKKNNYPVANIDQCKLTQDDLGKIELENIKFFTLLFQTGYITIKSYNVKTKNYELSYPNEEVRQAFSSNIVEMMTSLPKAQLNEFIEQFREFLVTNDMNSFCKNMYTFFAKVPYMIQIPEEYYYQSLFFVVMSMLGADIDIEKATNVGRIDAVIENQTHIYIFEFKFNKPVEHAIEQIFEKKYFEGYKHKPKKIVTIGMTFNLDEKNLRSDWEIKEL